MASLTFPSPTQLKNLSVPTDNSDAATKAYVDAQISGNSGGTLTADVDNFTGDGSNVSFMLANTPSGENFTMVAVQGVLQPKTTYSLSGNILTFTSAPPETAIVEVTTFGGSVVAGGGVSLPSQTGNNGKYLTTDGTTASWGTVSQGSSAFTWNIASSNATMIANNGYFVDTSGGAKTMTLPISATLGDTIRINDLAGSFSTNNLTVARNGHKIQGVADDLLIDADQSSFGLVYSNSTYGWKVLEL